MVDMTGRLHADIFFQDRYMLNEVNVKIKLVRSKDAFCVMSETDYKVMITKAAMFMRKVKLSPSAFLAHAKALDNGTAKYRIRRVVCKTFTVSNGFRHINHEHLFSGQLPTFVIVGLVRRSTDIGNEIRSTFSISVSPKYRCIWTMELNYADSYYIRAYNTLFTVTGKICRDEGIAIDRNDYANGYALYTFDLAISPQKWGAISMKPPKGTSARYNVIMSVSSLVP